MFVCLQQQRKWLYYIVIMIINNLEFIYGRTDKCDDLPEPEHTKPHIDQPPFDINTTLTFQCKPGYVDSGIKSTAKCVIQNNNTEWIVISKCKAVSCDFPGDIPNGRRIGEDFRYAKNVTYVCNDGYKISGIAVLFCGTDSEWTNSPPVCNIISCPRPQQPENGVASFSSVTYKSQVIYSCNRGFHLNGPNERECQGNGKWSGNDPKCLEKTCPDPGRIPGGYYVKLIASMPGKFIEGDIIIYYCNKTNIQVTSKCQNGFWNQSPPKCDVDTTGIIEVTTISIGKTTEGTSTETQITNIPIPDKCLNISKIEHGTVIQKVLHTVTFKCDKGYRIKGPTTLKCLPSGRWDSKPPTCEKGLPIGYILGIVFGITALIAIIIGVTLYFVKRRKSQSPIKPNKASYNDAVNIEELQKLEKNHRPIPVTVL